MHVNDTEGCARGRTSRMVLPVGWVLGALTWASLGLACDTPRRPSVKPPLVQRAFPETTDFRTDSSIVNDRPAAPVTARPVPAPSPRAGASVAEPALASPKPERVAAVLLMLPAGVDDPAGSRGTRTYKVSLGADLGEARVEIDGRDMGALAVRRAYPQPRLANVSLAGPTTPAPLASPPRARPAQRTVTAINGHLPTSQTQILNPNGAPIID